MCAKFIYIPNENTQNNPILSIKIKVLSIKIKVVESFDTQLNKQTNRIKST